MLLKTRKGKGREREGEGKEGKRPWSRQISEIESGKGKRGALAGTRGAIVECLPADAHRPFARKWLMLILLEKYERVSRREREREREYNSAP